MNLERIGAEASAFELKAELVDAAESRRTLTIVMGPARLSETGGKGQVWAEPSMEWPPR